jgi:hypothetical protein
MGAGRTYLALVHHPVRGRDGGIITTSITNLDVHDLASVARTYSLAGYFIVTPIAAQRALVDHMLGYWREGDGARRVPERAEALSRVSPVASIEEAMERVRSEGGGEPLVITTAARSGYSTVSFQAAREQIAAAGTRPVLLLFGTGYGLADELIARATMHLAPIRPGGDYNHLAVRSAVAIIVDRLFGDEGAASSVRTGD